VQSQRLSVIRAELGHTVYRHSPQARRLDEQITAFVPADLGRLPGEEGVEQR
jgi:hypothetical protein